VVTFVRGEAKRQGLRLEKGAAESLAERVGSDLLVIRSELAKLGLFAGEGKGIAAELVAESVADLAEEPIWDLTDAIGQGNTEAALRVLRRIRGAGAPEPVVLGALANHWRKLVRIRDGGEVSGHPFAVKKLKSQAARYGPAQLAAGLEGIWELDEILKGRGALEPDLALERLVLNLSR
jgi:DNA polymerase-3 subunit delta